MDGKSQKCLVKLLRGGARKGAQIIAENLPELLKYAQGGSPITLAGERTHEEAVATFRQRVGINQPVCGTLRTCQLGPA